MEESNKVELSFEQAMERLEKIVASLDGGDAPLDDSLALFEEGVRLVRLCSEKLDKAEQKVRMLTRGADGKLVEKEIIPGIQSDQ